MKNQARSDVQLSELLSDVKRRVLIWTTLRTLGWATVAGVGVGGALIWSGSIFGLPSAAVTLFWAIPALVLATTTVLVFRAYGALTPDRLALLVADLSWFFIKVRSRVYILLRSLFWPSSQAYRRLPATARNSNNYM